MLYDLRSVGKKRVIKKGSEQGDSSGEQETNKRREEHGARGVSRVLRGIAHVQATYNNMLINISDERGNALAWSSSGSLGFSGAKKATPFAAARVAEAVAEKVKKIGIQEVAVRVSGIGSGRDSAIRALANHGITVLSIKDITPLPHNGPRPKKARRV